MSPLLADFRVRRLLAANVTGSIGSGVTILAVPWLLVQRPDGDQLYGYATLATTVVLFFLIPYYGAWLDRHSRKRMLLAGEAFGFVATLAMAIVASASDRVETWQLLVTYFCGMLYFTLHYPAKFAFVQQVFDRRHYQALTGLIEIQGQTSSMAAGALASLLIVKVPFATILWLDACTYLVSFLLQRTIPYTPTHLTDPADDTGGRPARGGAWRAMAAGGRWLLDRPRLLAFLLSTYVPFICVMVGNYLFPIYVKEVLRARANVFGGGEIAFALGALSAGFVMPALASRHGADRTLVGTMAVFALALGLLVAVPATSSYFAALALLGFGSAGSRVARSAVVLTLVPPTVIGRVQLAFAAFDRVLRTILVFGATTLVIHSNAAAGFGLLGATAVGAFIGMLVTREAVRTAPVPLRAAA